MAPPAPPPDPDRYRLRRFPNGVWRIVWTAARVTRSRSTGCRGRRDAERVLARFLEEQARPPEAPRTVAALLTAYLEDRKGHVVAHRRLVAAAKALTRHLGWLGLADLRASHGRRHLAARRAEGVRDGTVGRELACLRAALRFAQAEGWLARPPPLELPPEPAPRRRWLGREEAARLVEACRLPHLRLFVLLALHTAARSGAIRALTWERVDLERRLVDLRVPGRATAKAGAVVPINDTLFQALGAARAQAAGPLVVSWRGRPVGCLARAFGRARTAAGLGPEVTPHVLRHTAATWLAQAGVPIERIAQYLGHSSPSITARVYAKHAPGWLAEAARALG